MEKQYLFVDEHICDICGEKFEKHSLLANHIRWKHNNQDDYIKKISDDKKRRDDIRLGEIKEFVVKCVYHVQIQDNIQQKQLKK